MKNGLSKEEADELKRRGLVLFHQYDTSTKRWSLVVNFINPPAKSTKPPHELAYSWVWEQGLKKNKLALRVLALINQFNKGK